MNGPVLKRIVRLLLISLIGVLGMAPASGATLQGLQVGASAPEFRLESVSGESAGFADLRGEKLTVVLFWSTWSRNSDDALSRMETLYRRYGDSGLGVIAVNADGQTLTTEAEAAVAATRERLGISFPMLLDDRLQTFHEYGVIALPTLVVLDRDRIIRYEMSGFPLVGVEKMVDFVGATIEGRSLEPQIAKETGYRPDPRALRFFNMGRKTLKSRRMRDMAEMWFKKAIEADADFIAPRLSLARFYLGRHEFAEASAQLSQVLEREPNNVAALCENAMLLDREGKTGEAKAMLNQGRQEDDLYIPCYYYLGYLTGRDGSLKEALPLFDQALEINRTSLEAHIYRGRMHEERQEMNQAAEAYRKALETLLGDI